MLHSPTGFNWCFSYTSDFSGVVCLLFVASQGSPVARQHIASVESSSLILQDTLCDISVLPSL